MSLAAPVKAGRGYSFERVGVFFRGSIYGRYWNPPNKVLLYDGLKRRNERRGLFPSFMLLCFLSFSMKNGKLHGVPNWLTFVISISYTLGATFAIFVLFLLSFGVLKSTGER